MAKEIQIKERLLEEQRWLKVEIEALKSPQRIETIAKERLQMYYPPKKVKQKQQQNNRERN